MASIGTHISALRAPLKLDVSDIRLTDRDIYAHMVSSRFLLVKRTDSKLQMLDKAHLFKPIGIDLIDVDVVQVCFECFKVKSDCTIKRSKDRLPAAVMGEKGPMIMYVSNLGQDQFFYETDKQSYARKIQKSTFKYDNTLYYWIEDGYGYFPNVVWDAVMISAMWENEEGCDKKNTCKNFQENEFVLPGDLIDPMYKMVWQSLGIYLQVPTKTVEDKNENT